MTSYGAIVGSVNERYTSADAVAHELDLCGKGPYLGRATRRTVRGFDRIWGVHGYSSRPVVITTNAFQTEKSFIRVKLSQ